jgi:WD40 repeat protein
LKGHTGAVYCLTLYGNKLFSGGGHGDRTIRVWNVKEEDS